MEDIHERNATYSVFHREIQLVYDRLEKESPSSAAIAIDPNNLEKSVRAMVQLCLPPRYTPDGWNNADDFNSEWTRYVYVFTARFPIESNYHLLTTAQSTFLYEYGGHVMNVEGV